jgi:hypothetical protein
VKVLHIARLGAFPGTAFAEHKADIRQYGPTLEEIRRDPIRGVTVRDADFTAK